MAESLEQGLILMAAGMGTVFALLALLVWLIGLVSRIGRWLDPAPAAAIAPLPASPAAVPASADGELVSIVSAAVAAHRQRQTQRPQ